MKDSYLITGGAGFIGTNVAKHFLSLNKRVTIFDNFARLGSETNIRWLKDQYPDLLTVVTGDVRWPGTELAMLVEKADVVFHLAAQVAVTTSVIDPVEDFEVNARGTFNVLEAIRKSQSRPMLVYSSTNKVYGQMAELSVTEKNGRYCYSNLDSGVPASYPLDFHSPYGCSKGCGDQYVLDYARIYNLKTVVFRQSCIYGPHQFGMEDQGWVAWFAIRAMQNLPFTIYGDGKQVRDVLFIDDLIAAYDAAIANIDNTSGHAYNIGGGAENTLSLLELVSLLEERFGRHLTYDFDDWRPGDQPVFVSDVRQARTDFGWKPSIGVVDGVSRLVDWLEENQALFCPSKETAKPHSQVSSVATTSAAVARRVSVIIPAKDEEETLGSVLEDLTRTVSQMPSYEVEIICVDDHSTDATATIARSYGARVVTNERKPGKGMALRAGFEAASGDILVMLDADYSHRAEELPRMLDALTEGVGLVIGSRVVGGSEEYTHLRALGNVFLSATLGLCTRRYLSDALNGFKVFRRDVFTAFNYTSKAFEIEIEIIANTLRKGYRVVEVSSHERSRAGGVMKSSVVRHGTRFLLRILWEGLRGVKPQLAPQTAATAAVDSLAKAGLTR